MNRHLNIFNFFNSGDLDYLEDNLSRAFAVCLKYDGHFLTEVLRAVLPTNKFSDIVKGEPLDIEADIDLQIGVNQLEGFTTVIGIACSGLEIADLEIEDIRETSSPVTDVCIRLDDICVLFEFKRTDEDCMAQLRRQAENVRRNCGDGTIVEYRDLSWRKIAKILHSLSTPSTPNENPFTGDFITYLERRFPEWLPGRPLTNISFPNDEDDPNFIYLNSRLNRIKSQIYGEEFTKEIIGRYNRFVIKPNFGWINEIQIEPNENNGFQSLVVRMHIGDTIGQGEIFFGARPDGVNWPQSIRGYQLAVEPYIKISNAYASALLWIRPTLDEASRTHCRDFFEMFAKRYYRDDWPQFSNDLGKYVGTWESKCFIRDGMEQCYWEETVTNSNRSLFQLSVGTMISVQLPFEECQSLDNCEVESPLVSEFRGVIEHIRGLID